MSDKEKTQVDKMRKVASFCCRRLFLLQQNFTFNCCFFYCPSFQSIETLLKMSLPIDNLESSLKDGVILCHLVNHIKPRSVSCIHVSSQSAVSLEAVVVVVVVHAILMSSSYFCHIVIVLFVCFATFHA